MIAATITKAQQLADAPHEERDLRWHVQAALVGDLSALASTALVTRELPTSPSRARE